MWHPRFNFAQLILTILATSIIAFATIVMRDHDTVTIMNHVQEYHEKRISQLETVSGELKTVVTKQQVILDTLIKEKNKHE